MSLLRISVLVAGYFNSRNAERARTAHWVDWVRATVRINLLPGIEPGEVIYP
jgi:hypothetical protein